jgi:hypothetical protein
MSPLPGLGFYISLLTHDVSHGLLVCRPTGAERYDEYIFGDGIANRLRAEPVGHELPGSALFHSGLSLSYGHGPIDVTGAESAGRLVKVTLLIVTLTITGTLQECAADDGNCTSI